jgi:hypothetical protein
MYVRGYLQGSENGRVVTIEVSRMDNEGLLRTKLYDKGDDFKYPIVTFPFICSNNPASSAYEVHISQFIRYSKK